MSYLVTILLNMTAGIFLAAGISKLLNKFKNEDPGVLERITSSSVFALFELICAVFLILPIINWVQASIATILSIIASAGLYRKLRGHRGCACFGPNVPIPTWKLVAMTVTTVTAACLLVVKSWNNPVEMGHFSVPAIALSLIICTILLVGALRYKGAATASQFSQGDTLSPPSVPLKTYFGRYGNANYNGETISSLGKPVLAIIVSAKCSACRALLHELQAAAEALNEYFTVVAVSAEKATFDGSVYPMLTMIDRRKSLKKFLKREFLPIALYMDKDLNLKMPIVVGEDRTIRLVKTLVSITEEGD